MPGAQSMTMLPRRVVAGCSEFHLLDAMHLADRSFACARRSDAAELPDAASVVLSIDMTKRLSLV